jgi:repressor LexA
LEFAFLFNTINECSRAPEDKKKFTIILSNTSKNTVRAVVSINRRHLKVKSKAGVAKHIAALEAQGLLSRRRENGSFWLDLQPPKTIADAVCEIEWLEIPKNEMFVQDWESQPLFVPRFLLGYQEPERLRAFRVTDDAMFNEHICEGDVALVEKRSYARDGDIVVAHTDKSIVLKQFYRESATVELRSANHRY